MVTEVNATGTNPSATRIDAKSGANLAIRPSPHKQSRQKLEIFSREKMSDEQIAKVLETVRSAGYDVE